MSQARRDSELLISWKMPEPLQVAAGCRRAPQQAKGLLYHWRVTINWLTSSPRGSRFAGRGLATGMLRLFAVAFLATGQAAAQVQPDDPQKDAKHMMGVVPAHGITNDKNAAPLTPSGKFRLFTDTVTDPFVVVAAGLQAGLSQAQNDSAGYGQGAAGYAKRFGAAYSDIAIGGFMTNYAFPSLLKEDPRYFRTGSGPFKKRLGHALASPFVTRTDSKTTRFNWSNVLGTITAGGISNLYYPAADRGVGLVFSKAAIGILYGTLGSIFSEFGPDIGKKMSKPKPKAPDNPQAP